MIFYFSLGILLGNLAGISRDFLDPQIYKGSKNSGEFSEYFSKKKKT